MAPPPSPEGLLIGPESRPWRVGRRLGSGACGSVHLIERADGGGQGGRSGRANGSGTGTRAAACGNGYVVKVAPVAPVLAGGRRKGGGKRKKTALERNADTLYHENTLYRNHLNEMRGVAVPEVPHPGDGGPPGLQDQHGFRFLCMERMEAPLSAAVDRLRADAAANASAEVDLSPIAGAMISHMEALHCLRLLFVDVKSENFMLAAPRPPSSSSSRLGRATAAGSSRKAAGAGTGAAAELAGLLRLIDFGLAESYRDVASGGHREDAHPSAALVGTPEYASLNVLGGHTASRRDDLEALGYVVADLVLQAVRGTASPGTFPWSGCRSDEEVLRVKAAEVEGKLAKAGGSFFSGMGAGGNAAAERAMREYFRQVRGIGYAERPDYEALRDALRSLVVRVGGRGGGGTPARATARRGGRNVVAVANPERDGGEIPQTKKRGAGRTARSAKRASNRRKEDTRRGDDDDGDVVMIDGISDDDGDDAGTAYNIALGGKPMDWEIIDENEEPSFSSSASAASASVPAREAPLASKGVLQVNVVGGPHTGEMFGIGGDFAGVITVGKAPPKPRNGSSSGTYKLAKEQGVAKSHAKLALYSAGGAHSVRVTDLKASGGITINGKEVPLGKYKQAFIGNKIVIGDTVLQIKRA